MRAGVPAAHRCRGQPAARVGRSEKSAHEPGRAARRSPSTEPPGAVTGAATAARGTRRGRGLRADRWLQAVGALAPAGSRTRAGACRSTALGRRADGGSARGQSSAPHAVTHGRGSGGLGTTTRAAAGTQDHRQGLRSQASLGPDAAHPGRAAMRAAAAQGRRGRARRDAGPRAVRLRSRRAAGCGRGGRAPRAQGLRGPGAARRLSSN